MPAIHKITKIAWLEQPFTRIDKKVLQETGKSKKQRFIDLATEHKGATCLFEIKHGWYNFSTNNFYSCCKKRWLNAIEQISHMTYRNLSIYERKNVVFYKMALMIVPTYISTSKSKNYKSHDANIKQNTHNIFNTLNTNKKRNTKYNYEL